MAEESPGNLPCWKVLLCLGSDGDVSTFAFERAYFYPRPRGDGSGTTAQSRWGGERFVENGEW